MKQAKERTREDYIKTCIEQGGEVTVYPNMEEACNAFLDFVEPLYCMKPEYYLENDTNCDWVIMGDGTVLHMNYAKKWAKIMKENGCQPPKINFEQLKAYESEYKKLEGTA